MSRRSRTLNRLIVVVLLVAAVGSIVMVAGMLTASPQPVATSGTSRAPLPALPSADAGARMEAPVLLANAANDAPTTRTLADETDASDAVADDAPLAPEHAVALGLAGLRDMFPADSDAETELLGLACKGSWHAAVTAYRAYAAPREHRFDDGLFHYLVTLRSAGAFIEARKDGALRAQAIARLNGQLEGRLGPIVRAGLFDTDDDVVLEALWQLAEYPQRNAAIYAQLQVIVDDAGPIAHVAEAVLAFLRDGASRPVRPRGGSIGHGDSYGHSSGMVYRRSRSSGMRMIETDGYTAADVPALHKRYRTGDGNERIAVATIVEHHGWPEAFDLAVEMLGDEIKYVRTLAISTLCNYATDDACNALIDHMPDEAETSLRRRIVNEVLAESSGAEWPTRERMFAVAMRDNNSVTEAALKQLVAGRVPASAYVIEAMVRDLFGREQAGLLAMATALHWLWANAGVVDVERAIAEGVRMRTGGHANLLINAIGKAFVELPDEHVVPLFELTLGHEEEPVRLHTVSAVLARFSDAALRVLRAVCAQDSDAVAAHAVSGLRAHIEDARVATFAADVATLRRRAVEQALTRLILQAGDIRMIDALLVLIESPDMRTRTEAMRASVPIGDVRHVDSFVVLLADVELTVVMQSVKPLLTLADQSPIDAAPLAPDELLEQHRRLVDRAPLYSMMLARLQAGDLEALEWFNLRFPRMATAVPGKSVEFGEIGPEIAAALADKLGVPIGDALDPVEIDD